MGSLIRDDYPNYRQRAGATFSRDETYRYWLWRTWNRRKPVIAFIMLNPSTADAQELDPTCRRCKNFAKDWGYGTLLVGNIFALCSTSPSNLYGHEDPVGPENDKHLQAIVEASDKVIGAWGTHGSYMDRATEVYEMLDTTIHALKTTKDGQPWHPLYVKSDREPFEWTPEKQSQT